ncbi:aldehyde dehydrogenase family protein [Haloarcula salina]|uniref:Aldehyde dehydrogenase family protein n=1 Tax=Haloarcula salina TaxID=1429914 RepID=A0AA41G3E4_9EURY|nr:aldehyde dehydrogenase family protein [Haloarcula salina]MBV0902914.1 aldehyde dehydrogenase family protein [Haloarcula salina]
MSPDITPSEKRKQEIRQRHSRIAEELFPAEQLKLYIDGKWQESLSEQTLSTCNPTTGDVLALVQAGTAVDIDRAVEAAWDAYDEDWSTYSAADRQAVLTEIADRVEARSEDFARIETLDNGKPITEARNDIDLVIDHFRYFAGVARVSGGKTVPSNRSSHIETLQEPYGVVGQIIPWNFPLLMAAWKLAPALAAGNAVVLKPAEETPLSILELMREIDDVLPDGVVNVVTGYGPEAGGPLVSHSDVPKIAFTGSTEVGYGVMKNAATTITDVTLELGGKSPVIVHSDADVEKAVDISIQAMFFNGGECCCAGTRLFVHEDIEDEFIDEFVTAVEQLEIGDPLDEETDVGPQVSPAEVDKTRQYIKSLSTTDVRILTGGERAVGERLSDGCFVTPTVISGIDHDERIAQEEIFGPVELVFTWDAYDEMITKANDVDYGLAAGVITSDLQKAYDTARDIEAGDIWVNTYNQFPAGQPFGGYKQSGIGREIGAETIENYTQTKTINFNLE